MKTSLIGVGNGVVDAPFSSTSFYLDSDYDWMKLSVSFTKKGWYSLFIWDPGKQLRVQSLYINEPKEILISSNPMETSFSSVPGRILEGEWKLEILAATYKAAPAYNFSFECGQSNAISILDEYEAWTDGSDGSGTFLNLYDRSKVLKTEQRWYKGDFHTHTTESDGKMKPAEGMDQAKKMGLDYFAATDHNILPTKWLKDDMLTIPGVEITSSKGHFNALGLTKWIDWRPTCEDGGMETEAGMNRILAETKEAGAIVSINHPMLKPWEWQFKETLLSAVDVIEIWNDPTYKDNPKATEKALTLWDTLWNDGHRIYGIGGSDSHLRPDESYEKQGPPSVIGDPATYVFADGLSADSILSGVRKGSVYVSRGLVLECHVKVDSLTALPGSDLSDYGTQDTIDFTYEITGSGIPEGAYIRWILNGTEKKVAAGGKISEAFSWSKDEWNWLRFEIRDQDGKLLAFANPVYSGEKNPSIATWGELMTASRFNV
ncbi:hypothetical protein DYI25_14940 [Mesobacillus boroniphilus]|uniref:Polymerase/histidinol phosphatase N-terminal domain-containing protein n=1 Tax=Mesobacillus boroniphilus TaxID=308892 RepID=A0A944CN68_9BACI|nr:CehA/McbA family metallohydrolase [Mesobacillus boroniphilus]MBS8265721.1 hypothetical protein [Mesobacillus boroniphilus]